MNEQMTAPEALNALASLPERTSASACFGSPVVAGDRTVVPIADVAYGLGFGWGGGTREGRQGTGGGGGGGARSRGIAVIELAPDGVRIHPIYDQTAITLAGLTLASAATAIASRTLIKLLRG